MSKKAAAPAATAAAPIAAKGTETAPVNGLPAKGASARPQAPNAKPMRGSPAPAAAAAEPVNGEVAQPGRNGATGRGDRQPANISMAQLAVRMSKRSGERSVSTRGTTPIATSRSPSGRAQQAEEAEAAAEELAPEQVAEADAGVNGSTELLPEGHQDGQPEGTIEADGAAPEGADLVEQEQEQEQEQEAEVLPKSVKELQARVNKLTARAKTAEARLAELQGTGGRGQETGGSGARATGVSPELQAIEGQLAVFREALEFAEANPDGGEYTDPATGRKTFYDAARVRTIRRNAEEGRQLALSDKAALTRQAQAEFAQVRQADQQAAIKAYPWLAKKPEALTETEAQMVGEFQEILRMQPNLKQAPDYVSWIADAVAGRQARLARGQGSGVRGQLVPNPNERKPAGGSRIPPQVVTRTAAAAPKVNPAQAAVKAADDQFRKTGNAKDYAKLLSAQAAARRQAA
jgi:hypothetical protein